MNHPHILAVYDWGEDDVPYLVSEYLGGGSLRSMLDAGHLLTVSQALMVGLEAARGLEYAHRQKIVHRDIKPANLLFDDETAAHRGLRHRLLAEAGWTEQGTVVAPRCASPEQAKGDPLTGKSDVAGLVLSSRSPAMCAKRRAISARGASISTCRCPGLGPLRRVLERAGGPIPMSGPTPATSPGSWAAGVPVRAAAARGPLPKEAGDAGDEGAAPVNLAPVLASPVPVTPAKAATPEPAGLRARRRPRTRDVAPPIVPYGEEDITAGAGRGCCRSVARHQCHRRGVVAYLASRRERPRARRHRRGRSHDPAEERPQLVGRSTADIAPSRIIRAEPVAGESLRRAAPQVLTSAGPEPIIPPLAGLPSSRPTRCRRASVWR
jgi:hypothetical protein